MLHRFPNVVQIRLPTRETVVKAKQHQAHLLRLVHATTMFPSTPNSKGFVRANGFIEPMPAPPSHLTRSRIPLAERIQKRINRIQGKNENESPSKGKRTSKVLPSPSRFGGERMVRAKSGHFKRPSLEANCLSAQGEDVAMFCASSAATLLLNMCSLAILFNSHGFSVVVSAANWW